MRIIAGSLGSRVFGTPGTPKTHPMSERVRGALFNMLGDLTGMSVLDAFAGSGALGFEAVSRGASHVLAIDSDRLAQKTIEQNITKLGVAGNVKLVKASAGAWLATNAGAQFDVVLCDPPYDNLQPELLVRLAACAKPGGVVTFSLPPNCRVNLDAADFRPVNSKNYGDAQLLFFVRD